jgi:catechol 2,3-dioxygenase-like lactoylglutathione lyase family enzyme
MPNFNVVVLYVKDINVSKAFYTGLLGRSPKELSPTFMSYQLASGLVLELWQLDKVHPAASLTGGGSELCIVLPDHDAVNRLYDEWKGRGVEFAQSPAKAVFGLTFVAKDPDGHRLRAVAGN